MKTSKIIAHRGGFLPEGPIPQVQNKYTIPENSIEAFKRAFDNGWGTETDARIWDDGSVVLIHDADTTRLTNNSQFTPPTLDQLCQLAQEYKKNGQPPFIAFQIKRNAKFEDGVKIGREIATKIEQYGLQGSILFDATLEEAYLLHREFPWLNLSVSVGEKNYSPTIYTPDQALLNKFKNAFNGIWADEWKLAGSILNKQMFQRLRAGYEGRIDVVSPELHYNTHPYAKNLNKLKKLWQEIISWETSDGICTDYSSQLQLIR